MKLAEYIRITARRERQRVAQSCGTTVGYLYQIAGGHRQPGVPLSLRIEAATRGHVCRCTLRPDVFPPGQCPVASHGEPRQDLPKPGAQPPKPNATNMAGSKSHA